MKQFQKLVKYVGRGLFALLVLLVLVVLLIQTAPVQAFLTQKTSTYLSNKLQTRVDIDAIQFRLRGALGLEGVYLEDQKADTLLWLPELRLRMKPAQLLYKTIQIDEVSLRGVRVYLQRDSSGRSNLDFISEAFASAEKSASEKKSATRWTIAAKGGKVGLKDIHFQFEDEAKPLSLDLDLEGLDLHLQDINLQEQRYRLASLDLKNTDFRLNQTAQTIRANLDQLQSDSLTFSLVNGQAQVATQKLSLVQGAFYLDKSDQPIIAQGFDPNHIHFRDIDLHVIQAAYGDRAASGDIRQLMAKTEKGFVLHGLQAVVQYDPKAVHVQELELSAGKSTLQSANSTIPLGTNANQPLATNLDIQRLYTSDLLYWAPALRKIPYFENGTRILNTRLRVDGSWEQMNIQELRLSDRDISLDLQGQIAHVTEPEKMQVDLHLKRLASSPKGIQAWLPKEAVPEYLVFPEENNFGGYIRGGWAQMDVQLWGETRRGPVPVLSRFAAKATLQELNDPDQMTFDLQIDTALLSRTDLLAYLPPDILPEGVELPESFYLQGQAQGQLSTFTTNLELLSARAGQSASVKVKGKIDSLTRTKQPTFLLDFSAEGWTRQELEAWLPTGTLPAPMRAPNLSLLQGRLSGRPDSLFTRFGLRSDLGNGDITATLVDAEDYILRLDFANLRPDRLYPPEYVDSTYGITTPSFHLKLQARGIGFDTSAKTNSDFILYLSPEDLALDSGLVLTGKVRDQILQGDLRSKAKALNLDGLYSFDYRSAAPETDLEFQLNQLDLYELGIAKQPLQLNGGMEAHFRGLSVDTLSGEFLARDWHLLFDSTEQSVDSLFLVANLDHGENHVEIQSDILQLNLDGYFQIPRAFSAMQAQLLGYFRENNTDTLVGQTSDHFTLAGEISKPELLTIGLIPGLQELEPTRFRLAYDNREAILESELHLPHIRWSDIVLDSIELESSFGPDQFRYDLFLRNANFQQIARVPATHWYGDYSDKELNAVFAALDTAGQNRFVLNTRLQNTADSVFRLRLDTKQLLDYQWWEMSPENEIALLGKTIQVQDWRLYRKEESITLKEAGKDEIKMLFSELDLDLIADILDQSNPYLAGILNGEVDIFSPLDQPEIDTRLKIDSLAFFDAALGDMDFSGRVDIEKVDMQAILRGSGHDLELAGRYLLKEKDNPFDLELAMNRVDLPSLEPLTFGYLEEMEGALAGNLRVTGSPTKPRIGGQVQFDSARFHVGMLNTQLGVGNQPILFTNQGVVFQDLEVFDVNDQRGVLSGGMLTSDFRDFDLQTDLNANNFTVLNTTTVDNDLYYGKMVVDANARIRGSLFAPNINLFAKSRRGSSLTYVYRQGIPQVESYQGIVEFVAPEGFLASTVEMPQLAQSSRELNMKISVKLDINEDLTFKVITNPLTNDYFEGKAAGNLNYTIFPDGRMELTGLLEMVEGEYLFTYQEVVRRNFRVQPGGTIRWTGDLLNPQLDIDVLYEAETSPYPLLVQEYENLENLNVNRKETFQVELAISGDPSDTEISTTLLYPEVRGNSGSPEIQQVIQQINRDPSQQNTQAFALILFNGFIGESSGQQDEFQVSDLELESNIGNLITKQLNNLANRYLKFVELDFDLENYEKDAENIGSRKADFRVSLRKEFLNDRLSVSLDGVASAQADPESTNASYFLDNLTVAYDLTPDGRFRVKVYNRRDYTDIIGGSGLQVGGALVFSKDFKEIRLFNSKNK